MHVLGYRDIVLVSDEGLHIGLAKCWNNPLVVVGPLVVLGPLVVVGPLSAVSGGVSCSEGWSLMSRTFVFFFFFFFSTHGVPPANKESNVAEDVQPGSKDISAPERHKLAFEIELKLPAFNRHSSYRGHKLEDLDPQHAKTRRPKLLSQ